MAKNIVYTSPEPFAFPNELEIKKAALFFDKIYYLSPYWPPNETFSLQTGIRITPGKKGSLSQEDFEFLQQENIIETINSPLKGDLGDEERQELVLMLANTEAANVKMDQLKMRTGLEGLAEFGKKFNEFHGLMLQNMDTMLRIQASLLSKEYQTEFYPMLRSKQSFRGMGNKATVVQLVLDQIPEPGPETPWETILDFRRDEDIRTKYLALLQWINDACRKDYTRNEIQEQIDYLSADYQRAVSRHKLKGSMGMLEVLIGIGAGLVTMNWPAAVQIATQAVKIATVSLNLREEEGKFPGREIAYLHHVRNTFGK